MFENQLQEQGWTQLQEQESHYEEGRDPFHLRRITHTLSNDDQCIFQHIIHIMHIMHILHMLHIWHA